MKKTEKPKTEKINKKAKGLMLPNYSLRHVY